MPDVCVEQAARLTMPASPWSTQSCVPHRQSCRWSAFEVLPSPPRRTLLLWDRHPMWGRFSSLRPAFQPAWVPFTHRPMLNPMPRLVGAAQPVRPFSSDLGALPYSRKGAVPRGASRQACHAGGHAGRATQSRPVREFQRHPAHTTARSTSTRPLSSYLRVLRGLFFSVSSVSSVLLARRFFSAREDFLCRHTCLVAALPRCGLLFCVSSVSSVVCFSPCPLWFAFSVPSPPPVTTFPKSFFHSFSTTCQLPLSPSLAPILYVESERCG